jgi:hypothetical protein
LEDFNTQLRAWVWEVANQRVHGTTHEPVIARWEADRLNLSSPANRPPYPYVDEELRKVARDAYVAWQGSRYSVPWQYAGREVWVRSGNGEEVEVLYGGAPIAVHGRAPRRHTVVTRAEHHQGIPLGTTERGSKIVVRIRESAPVVEIRPLAAYESAAAGGVR